MSERERLDVDVLIVGAGPAGLSAAIRLAARQQREGGRPLTIAVLDKATEPGAHALSGAVLDPSALRELVPDFETRGAPLKCPVTSDALYFLTERRRWRCPWTPPALDNHGNFVISLNAFVKWLAEVAESGGVDLINGVAAAEVLREDGRVVGVRTRDLGLNKLGQPTGAFQPGVDVRASVTIFCDGARGNLTKTLVKEHGLDRGRLPQVYALGLKELWEVEPKRLPAGSVMHTLGYPLTAREFGGGFIYGLGGGIASVGLVVGLDYPDPMFDPYVAFQQFKQHPFVSDVLKGGSRIRYGAKALPEGGWYTIPKVHLDGALIAGDAGGFLNSMRLKGIHLAMRTGMLAADAAFKAVQSGDASEAALESYQEALDNGPVRRELFPVRNVHQMFERHMIAGLAFAGWSMLTGGWWFRDPVTSPAGYERLQKRQQGSDRLRQPWPRVTIDRTLTFDRATNVHFSGTRHREDQPSHLIVQDLDICRTRCVTEYANPCTRFCPANVYEMVDDGQGGVRLHLNPSNCVHCKTCDIMDPYQIVDWVPPEGGEGPRYLGM